MDLHPIAEVLFLGIVGILTAGALVWLYAGLGAWMEDAFHDGRWSWFGLLLVLTFPAGLIAWLTVRAFLKRRRVAT